MWTGTYVLLWALPASAVFFLIERRRRQQEKKERGRRKWRRLLPRHSSHSRVRHQNNCSRHNGDFFPRISLSGPLSRGRAKSKSSQSFLSFSPRQFRPSLPERNWKQFSPASSVVLFAPLGACISVAAYGAFSQSRIPLSPFPPSSLSSFSPFALHFFRKYLDDLKSSVVRERGS